MRRLFSKVLSTLAFLVAFARLYAISCGTRRTYLMAAAALNG
jgi:hypothetical protein